MAQNILEKNQKVYIPRYEHRFCDDTMVMGSHVKLLFLWLSEDLD